MTTTSASTLRRNLLTKSLPYGLLPMAMALCCSLHVWLFPRSALTAYTVCCTTLIISSTRHPLPDHIPVIGPIRRSLPLLYTGLKTCFAKIDADTIARCDNTLANTHAAWLQSAMFFLLYAVIQPCSYVGVEAARLFSKNPEILTISFLTAFCHFGLMHLAIDGLDFSSYTALYQRSKAQLPHNLMELLAKGLPTEELLATRELAEDKVDNPLR
jgi:hypothetical protein